MLMTIPTAVIVVGSVIFVLLLLGGGVAYACYAFSHKGILFEDE
jgi:hypothetical protein